jgi:hypothetical protein
MRKTIVTVALAAMVTLFAGVARADDGKAREQGPAKKADNASKEAPKVPADALTHESLKKRLEDMGYTFKTILSTTKTPMYLVTVDSNNYRYVFYVSLSSDMKRLWVSCALRQLPEPNKVRADILEKLLAKNYDLGPTHFAVKSNRYLYLELALDNHGLGAAKIRGELDEFKVAIRTTETLWNPEKYPAPPALAKDAKPKDAK